MLAETVQQRNARLQAEGPILLEWRQIPTLWTAWAECRICGVYGDGDLFDGAPVLCDFSNEVAALEMLLFMGCCVEHLKPICAVLDMLYLEIPYQPTERLLESFLEKRSE